MAKTTATKAVKSPKKSRTNAYRDIIEAIFFKHYQAGDSEVSFSREEIEPTAADLNIALPKNLGDVIYALRYRVDFPASITETAKKGMEWAIIGVGRSKYKFKQFKFHRLLPRKDLLVTKIPDSTPEIIAAYAQGDEQALLARVRYNRLVDTFLGITGYSLQNHLRTSLEEVGQIEIDEIYVGIDKHGAHFIVPVQAKGGKDKHGVVQTLQDIDFCRLKYPNLVCRCVSAQFIDGEDGRKIVAMFELLLENEDLRVVSEKHYELVPATEITSAELERYKMISTG
jgi:hypothetical protein